MKKLFTLLAFLLTVVTASKAQELVNANFAQGVIGDVNIATYKADGETHWMQDVPGWSLGVENGEARAAGVVAYGSGTTFGGSYGVPAAGPEGTNGNALGMVGVWMGTVQYVQDITLPEGKYKMTVPVYNTCGTQAVVKNLIGVKYGETENFATTTYYPVGQWTMETVEFELTETTDVTVSLGIEGANCGSGASQHLFIDCVKIETSAEGPVVAIEEGEGTYTVTSTSADAALYYICRPYSYLGEGKTPESVLQKDIEDMAAMLSSEEEWDLYDHMGLKPAPKTFTIADYAEIYSGEECFLIAANVGWNGEKIAIISNVEKVNFTPEASAAPEVTLIGQEETEYNLNGHSTVTIDLPISAIKVKGLDQSKDYSYTISEGNTTLAEGILSVNTIGYAEFNPLSLYEGHTYTLTLTSESETVATYNLIGAMEGPEKPAEIKGYLGTYNEDGSWKKLVEVSGGLFTWAARLEEQGYYLTIVGNDWEDKYFLNLTTGSLDGTKTYYEIDEDHDILVDGKKKAFFLEPTSEEALRYAVNMTVDLKGLVNQAKTIDLTGLEASETAAFLEALAAAENANQFVDDFGDLAINLQAEMDKLDREPLQPFHAYIALYDESGKPFKVIKVADEYHNFIFKPSNQGYYITLSTNNWEDLFYMDLVTFDLSSTPIYYPIVGDEIFANGKAIAMWLDATDERFSNYLENQEVDPEDIAFTLAVAKAYNTTGHSESLVKDLEDAIAALENADLFNDNYNKLMQDVEDVLAALAEETTGISSIDVRPATKGYGIDGRRANRGIVILNGHKTIVK